MTYSSGPTTVRRTMNQCKQTLTFSLTFVPTSQESQLSKKNRMMPSKIVLSYIFLPFGRACFGLPIEEAEKMFYQFVRILKYIQEFRY